MSSNKAERHLRLNTFPGMLLEDADQSVRTNQLGHRPLFINFIVVSFFLADVNRRRTVAENEPFNT